MHRTVSLAALLVAGLRSAALAAPDPDPLTVKHLTVAEARRLVAVQDAKPEFLGLERYCDACDGLVAVGGSPDVVAAMRQAARHAAASVRTPFAADLFEAVRDPALVRDKALFRSYLPLPRLTRLDADVAAVLAGFPGELSFDELRSLAPEAARSLADSSFLLLDGLEELAGETATGLLDMPTPPATFFKLSLNGLCDLTLDTATRIAKRARQVRLDGLRVLEPEVARALVGPAEDNELFAISLRGLRDLPAATARELARFPGTCLDLAGLRRLEPDTAAALSAYSAGPEGENTHSILDLSGLATLSPAAARALVRRDGPRFRGLLDLSGLRDLPVDTARALHHHPGPLALEGLERLTPEATAALVGGSMPLGLRGLRELSPPVAAALAQHRGPLIVAAIAPLPIPVAEALGSHAGPLLTVAELESLTPETAAALARHPGELSFPHLETLSPACAAAFATHAGDLSFAALREAPEAVLEQLAASQASSLGVQARRLTAQTAEALANRRGDVWIVGLHELDSPALATQARFDTSLLTRITPAALRALTQREDNRHGLVLSGLTTLALDQAEALAGYRGFLDLDGVRELAPAVARALAAGRPAASEEPTVGSFSLRGLATWDPEVLRHLLATRRVNLGLQVLSALTPQRAAALVAATGDDPLELPGIVWLDAPDAVDVARELAKKQGVLALPNLEAVSPRGLAALLEAEDPRIPDAQDLELLPERDGSNDDVPLPAGRSGGP